MARRQRDYKAEYQRRQANARSKGYRSYGQQRYAKEKLRKDSTESGWSSLVALEFLLGRKLTNEEFRRFELGFMPYPDKVRKDINRVKRQTNFDRRTDRIEDIEGRFTRSTREYRARSIAARQSILDEFPEFDWGLWKVDYGRYTRSDGR